MAMITTIHGDMDTALLEKLDGVIDNDTERTYWVEYRLPGNPEIVHRSVDMVLKQAPVFGSGDVSAV
jgi:hypothetical protein